jgi:hypothetical protein
MLLGRFFIEKIMNSKNGPYFVQPYRVYFQVVLNEVKNGVFFVHYIQILPLPSRSGCDWPYISDVDAP